MPWGRDEIERELNVDRQPRRKLKSEMGQKRETGEYKMRFDKRIYGGKGIEKGEKS